jgi:hypothetical protein
MEKEEKKRPCAMEKEGRTDFASSVNLPRWRLYFVYSKYE